MPKEQKQPTGLLARWRERRRQKAVRTGEARRGAEASQRGDAGRAERNNIPTRPM